MQYLHKIIGDEVDFLPADKHKSVLQDDSIYHFGYALPGMPKVPKTTGLKYLCNKYVKENVKDKVHFLPADKH